MNNKRISFFCFFVSLAVSSFSQDAAFMNSSQSLVYLNPSYSGSNGFIRNQLNLRDQSPSLSGTNITYYNCFDAYIKPIKGGVSVSAFLDDQVSGTLKTTSILAAYAQHFFLFGGKLKIIPSVQGGYTQKNLDKEKLNYGDMIDLRRGYIWYNTPVPQQSLYFFDYNAGLLLQTKNLSFGTSVFHITQPKDDLRGIGNLPLRINFHVSYNFPINPQSKIVFFGLVSSQQHDTYCQFNTNFIFRNKFVVGLSYKSTSTIYANVGLRFKFLSAFIGYENSFRPYPSNSFMYGSYEFMLCLNLKHKSDAEYKSDWASW